jgi:hypothetical protein
MVAAHQELQIVAIFAILVAATIGVTLPVFVWKSNENVSSLTFRLTKVIISIIYSI